MYKVHTKILTKRLSLVLPKILFEEQGAFIKGKDITDSIALTSELTYELNRKVRGGKILFNGMDMMKGQCNMS